MTRSITVLFVLIASVALVSADLIVSAQNTNSSTTQNSSDEQTRGGTMTSQNDNTSSTGSSRRGRRRRRRPARNTNMSGDMAGNANMAGDMTGNTNASDDTQNTNMTGDMTGNTNMAGDTPSTMSGGGRRRRGRRRGNRVRLEETSGYMQNQELERTDGRQEDLAGQSYSGTVEYSEGSMNGPATLSFESGNQFTLTPEGGTAMSGRYAAVTTRGYTGVTMMFSGSTPPSIVSVRLRKMGNGVSIMSVPGESRQFSFTSSSGGGNSMTVGGRQRRGRRMRRGRTRSGIKPPMTTPETSPEASSTP